MNVHRQLLNWYHRGALNNETYEESVKLVSSRAAVKEWRSFLDRLLLFSGILMSAAGVVFFYAWNWKALTPFWKLFPLEVLFSGVLVLLLFKKKDNTGSKALMVFLFILTGALLALIGQIYQTGADRWQLFALWALLTLPLVIIARFSLLWVLFLVLVNLAWHLYGDIIALPSNSLSVLRLRIQLVVNAVALVAAEKKCIHRWLPRLITVGVLFSATALAVYTIDRGESYLNLLFYSAIAGGLVFFYLKWNRDLFLLACLMFSLIILTVTWTGVNLEGSVADETLSLIIAGIFITFSTAGVYLMKKFHKGGVHDKG